MKNRGEVSERFKVQSWKGCVGANSTVGSNPTLSELKKNNPGSSSGRTEDSGSSNGGSNPSPGIFKKV